MTALLMTPVVLALLLVAAHLSRQGLPLWVAVLPLLLAGLLAVRRRWAARTLQAVLLLGAAEWVRTTLVLASVRREAGLPATRMVVILSIVALLTVMAAGVFRHPLMRERFRLR